MDLRSEEVSDDVQTPGTTQSISVVIPSRNRHELVTAVVEKLLAENGFLELVVVDDGSTDRTADALSAIAQRDPRLRTVAGPGEGASTARTLGAKEARGDIVLFLDDDVMPDQRLPELHLARHGSSSTCVVVGYMPTRTPDQPGPESFTTVLYATEYETRCQKYDEDPSRILRNLWMGNVSLPREAFLDVTERWPEPLPHVRHEDQIIGMRLLSLGMSARFDRELRGTHRHQRTLKQFRRDCRLEGAGRALLEMHNGDMLDRFGAQQFGEGLSRSLVLFIAATRHPRAGNAAASALATMTWALGAARAFGVQTVVGKLLRRVEQQQGYLAQATASGMATS
jgi:hypothetical protein